MEFEAQSSWPVRVSVMTFNVWGNDRWPERKDALQETVRRHRPDVLYLQEVTPQILQAITEVLPSHKYVVDSNFKGWSTECNIVWNNDLLEKTKHEFVDAMGFEDNPHRGLFTALLRVRSNPQITFAALTVHFPWPGCPAELRTGMNQRALIADKIVDFTGDGSDQAMPFILAGDFNESFHPQRILRDAGYEDVFSEVGVPPPVTHPVRSASQRESSMPPQALDWIMIRGSGMRVLTASAVDVRGPDLSSDHLPVVTVVELGRAE